jgi:hypothetical protein
MSLLAILRLHKKRAKEHLPSAAALRDVVTLSPSRKAEKYRMRWLGRSRLETRLTPLLSKDAKMAPKALTKASGNKLKSFAPKANSATAPFEHLLLYDICQLFISPAAAIALLLIIYTSRTAGTQSEVHPRSTWTRTLIEEIRGQAQTLLQEGQSSKVIFEQKVVQSTSVSQTCLFRGEPS